MKIENFMTLITVPPPGTQVKTEENYLGIDEFYTYGGPDGHAIIPRFRIGDSLILGFEECGHFKGYVCSVKSGHDDKDDPQNLLPKALKRFHIPESERSGQILAVAGDWKGDDPHTCVGQTEFGSFFLADTRFATIRGFSDYCGDEPYSLNYNEWCYGVRRGLDWLKHFGGPEPF